MPCMKIHARSCRKQTPFARHVQYCLFSIDQILSLVEKCPMLIADSWNVATPEEGLGRLVVTPDGLKKV